MAKSIVPIINHIPLFLNYCNSKGLSKKTQISYESFLERFSKWLKTEKKSNLLPHQITIEDINIYKSYLSSLPGKENGQKLSNITQNLYLTALRVFFDYFEIKNIKSLPSNRISLLRHDRKMKELNFLNNDYIKLLLLSPDSSNLIGLRDRALLAMLIYGGLRVNQIASLNKNQLGEDHIIPNEAFLTVQNYLRSRTDDCEALFINHRQWKHSHSRLTTRSIERTINYYGRKIGLPYSISPETLRWARAQAILNKEIEIKNIYSHENFIINDYLNKKDGLSTYNPKIINHHSPPWDVAENAIKKEQTWLKNSLSFLPLGYKRNPSFLKCDDCILRKLAILIVSGDIKATQLNYGKITYAWNGLINDSSIERMSHHGQEWHKKMMDIAHKYFELRKCKINMEPVLNYGRADLEIKIDDKRIIIEIGTVSLYKIWYNFSTMHNCTFLIIPNEATILEFKT